MHPRTGSVGCTLSPYSPGSRGDLEETHLLSLGELTQVDSRGYGFRVSCPTWDGG